MGGIESLPDRYVASRLAAASEERRRVSLRVLHDFDAATAGLGAIDGRAVEAFLSERLSAGEAPGTLRKKRTIIGAFSTWAYSEGVIDAERLLDVRAARSPVPASRLAAPRPYRLGELRALAARLDERWPKYRDADEAERWLTRYRDGRSPYSRVRSHVTRCQLDAVIAQALHLGLRRREVFALDVVTAHPDNDELIVYRDEAHTLELARLVPNTRPARAAMAEWDFCRWVLQPEHTALWLNTHARATADLPMTRETFDRLLRTYVGPGWTLKRLRDTCAVRWVRRGLSPEHLRQLLGIAHIEDMLPYVHLAGGSLDGALCVAEAIDAHPRAVSA